MKNQLREIIPLESGGSFKLLWEMLYHIRLLKYVRQSHLKLINPRYSKICSVKKLNKLVELSLLNNPEKNVYTTNDDALPYLKDAGFNIKTLPKITGSGGVNELNNTEIFIQALKLPDFRTLLYPSFDYIRPDVLLVRQKEKGYKLEFLEVEASKPNWKDWIENKRINYLKLAKDRQVFSYWKAQATYLNLPVPEIKDFKFSVSFIGKINLTFGKGFTFREKLCP